MKKSKSRNGKAEGKGTVASKAPAEAVNGQEPEPVEEEAIEVNDPGDCIGHWAACEECEMCEIQDSCQAMTRNINGEVEGNGEKE